MVPVPRGRRGRKQRMAQPSENKFLPFATMFKLEEPGKSLAPRCVACVSCGAMYPLSDLLGGELNEDECPHCKVRATDFYCHQPHQRIEHNAG